MRRILKRLPSPALVISVIALVAALSGTAIAGGFITGKKFKKQGIRGPVTYVTTTQTVNNNNDPSPSTPGVNLTALCPSGFFPTGGGAKSGNLSGLSGLFIQFSYPSTPNGWTVNVFGGTAPGGTATPETVSAFAACVKAKQSSGTLPAVSL